jgi:hypothetical protein
MKILNHELRRHEFSAIKAMQSSVEGHRGLVAREGNFTLE